jgi:hypothetical protein
MADIKHQISIASSTDAIFALITSGKGLAQWWAEDVFDESDSVVSLGFFGRTTVYRLRRQPLVQNSSVTWQCETGKEWEGTRLVFELIRCDRSRLLAFARKHKGTKAQ